MYGDALLVKAGKVFSMLILVFAISACAPTIQMNEDPDDYRDEVAQLQRQITENPSDATLLRDLGAIYVRTGRPAEGYTTLRKAFARDSDDPKTLFFLGVATEKIGRPQTALRLYERFDRVPEDSRYRSLMEGRHQWLLREQIRQEVAQMLEREEALTGGDVSPQRIAVLPFSFIGGDEKYAPLGQGLSEMISVDLASIDRLQLVERVRLQVLLNELQLAQSQYIDPSSAPRVGKLLGAGRLVGGSYAVAGDEEFRVDVALAELTGASTSSDLRSQSGDLEDLFAFKREIVFGIVDRLGIELTAEERAQIESVPTRNLQAFLAYSRGLEAEARGNFRTAAQSFQQARQLDPAFSRAAERQRTAEGASATAGSADQALGAVTGQVQVAQNQIDLVQNRQQVQSETLGTTPVADDDGSGEGDTQRQPAAESENTAPPEVLKDPPPPPSSGNK